MTSDPPDTPATLPDWEDPGATEAEAALALGRLDGRLIAATPAVLRVFAGRVLRAALTRALAQEGHGFTEWRFDAWFAGLVPLTEASAVRPARGARLVAEALLAELTHSSWAPLAECARALRPALLAPRDALAEDVRAEIEASLAEARALVADVGAGPGPLPFTALRRLHAAIAASPRFAPGERARETLRLGSLQMTVERAPPPSPRWAIELVYGQQLHAAGLIAVPLPCPGLVRLDALADDEPETARMIRARALGDMARDLGAELARAEAEAAQIAARLQRQRSSSRAPALAELLAGFGALRSAQLEVMLDATRLGVRGMLTTLIDSGLVTRGSVSGVWLYSLARADLVPAREAEPAASPAFSRETLAEYEAANADIDRLLTRLGIAPDEDEA